jgi:glycosyltransferase involved in cell wall biosynthesis
MKKRVLFITHESSLSGAPILLLNLVNLLAASSQYEISMIVYRGGPLENEFHKAGESVTLKPASYMKGGFLSKIRDYLQYKKQLRKAMQMAKQSHVIFSNTITNGRLLQTLSPAQKPVVLYVHELENVVKEFNKFGDSELSLGIADCILTPSSAVRNNLVENHDVEEENILPLNYYFPANQQVSRTDKDQKRREFLNKYGIAADKFLVAGMGTATWRKGFDIFVEACRHSAERGENIHWIWVGDFIEPEMRSEMEKVIGENNISNHITITGFLPKAADNLLPFDLFLLPSREDPYPLVVLEAAYLGIPAVCFREGGGIIDFVSGGAGFIVDEIDAASFANAVIQLKQDPSAIQIAGRIAKEKALNLHSSESLIMEQFNAAIQKAGS